MISSLLVRHSWTRRELPAMKFGGLQVWFGFHFIPWFCAGVDDIGTERVNLCQYLSPLSTEINQSGGRCGKIQVGFVLIFVFHCLSDLFFFFALLLLDLSDGKIFQSLPLLFLESGRTSWHSLGDLELVSVIGFHLWSESYFYLWSCSSAFCLIFLESSLPMY